MSGCLEIGVVEIYCKGHKGIIWSVGNILYLDCGHDYTGVYICQN